MTIDNRTNDQKPNDYPLKEDLSAIGSNESMESNDHRSTRSRLYTDEEIEAYATKLSEDFQTTEWYKGFLAIFYSGLTLPEVQDIQQQANKNATKSALGLFWYLIKKDPRWQLYQLTKSERPKQTDNTQTNAPNKGDEVVLEDIDENEPVDLSGISF